MNSIYDYSELEHLSDYQLDQLYLGELSQSRDAEVRSHLQTCLLCKKRQKLRDDGVDAFPEFDSDAVLKRIQLKMASLGENSEPAQNQRPSLMAGVAVSSLACAAAVLLYWPNVQNEALPKAKIDQVRAKGGGLSLQVFRKGIHGGEEVLPGQTLVKGDSVMFKTDFPTELYMAGNWHAMIMSIEEDNKGKTNVLYPHGERQSEKLMLNKVGAFPFSMKLDGYIGRETLLVVVCPRPFLLNEISVGADKQSRVIKAQKLSPDCRQSAFEIHKAAL